MSGASALPLSGDLLTRAAPWRRALTLAIVLVGFAACAPAGGPVLALSTCGAAGVVLGRWVGRPSPRGEARWRVLNTSALVVCVLAAFAKVPLLVVGAGLVGWLQVHRAWTGAQARDDRSALLLALLQALLGCIVSVSMVLAPLFLALVLLGPLALALCHLGIEAEGARARRLRPVAGERTATSSLWVLGPGSLLLTLAFFVGLPRLDAAGHLSTDEAERVTGFGEDVDIGDLGALLESDEPVMRVRVFDAQERPWTGPLYLRGAALDAFDGRRWTSTVGRGGRWEPPGASPAAQLRQEFLLEPVAENVVFGMQEVVRIRGTGRRLSRDANGTLRYRGEPERLQYTAWSVLPSSDTARLSAARPDPRRAARSVAEREAADAGVWTRLPADLDPRVPALARQAAAAAGPDAGAWQQAVAIAAFLQREYSYSLEAPDLPGGGAPPDPLAWFLFESRTGHCEYFATALAVMLRSLDIPARVVNGFLGGELNPLGGWILVRQRDAHSWVEVNLGPQGWVVVDATPAGGAAVTVASTWTQAGDWLTQRWQGVVLEYGLDDQLSGLARVGQALALPGGAGASTLALPEVGGLVVVGLAVGLVAALVRGALAWLSRPPGPRPAPRGPVERLHDRAWAYVRRRGWNPPLALPPVEAAVWVRQRVGPLAEPLVQLAWLRYRVRYGGDLDRDLLAAAEAAWQSLRRGGLPRAAERGRLAAGPASGPGTD
ncbi:DUF3488 and transglutaminase-like domain-containing protein [Myxococcota bacterium]|nr:DUF3488 and transglutaminase-like domain-containing protein [Myxococcota bacterium]